MSIARNRWGFTVAIGLLVVGLYVYNKTPQAWPAGSDGRYSWAFARSLAFDGDIHFLNDYVECGDTMQMLRPRYRWRPDNVFYVGPALFWTPMLRLMRFFMSRRDVVDTCGPPWTTICLRLSPCALALAGWFSYRLARRHFTDGVAAAAVLFCAAAGYPFLYGVMLPSFSHIYDALCVSAMLLLAVRAAERARVGGFFSVLSWLWAGLALGACVLQRSSNVMFGLCIAVLMVMAYKKQLWRGVVPALLVLLGTAAGVIPQLLIYKYLYGKYLALPQGPYFMNFAQAHPGLLLFAGVGGLFYVQPTAWLAVVGIVPALLTPKIRPLVIPLLIVAALETYISSAALDWEAARRLTNLLPLLVLLAAFPLRGLYRWLSARPGRALALASGAAATPFLVFTIGLAYGGPRLKVPFFDPAEQEGFYGAATASFWGMIDEGPLAHVAILPAEIWFKRRYGVAMQRFPLAAHAVFYNRDFRTLEWLGHGLDMRDARVRSLMLNVSAHDRGVSPAAPLCSVVFAAQWPVATHMTVHASALRPVWLRIGQRRSREIIWFGDAFVIKGNEQSHEVTVPEGGFGSGLNELVFETRPIEGRSLVISSIDIHDRRELKTVFEL